MRRLHAHLSITLALLVLVAPLAVAVAADCTSLPKSALRPRPCNPREECLKSIPADLKGPVLEARKKECSRQPAEGTCYGPEMYNPQAECRSEPKK